MADNENFDRLASSLSLEERNILLEKLKAQSKISQEPLYYVDDEQDVPMGIEDQFHSLPWYNRFWYFFLGLIKSRAPVRLYEDRLGIILGKKVEELSPGFYDYHLGVLLPALYMQLTNLKNASRFFYTALDAGFNKDKGAFYAFLGSLEMPDIHTQLQAAANPALLEQKNPEVPEVELRSIAQRYMDDALKGITDEHRGVMYYDTRSLLCLKELSSFLFDRLLVSFVYNAALKGYTCTAIAIKEMLLSLNNILFSLRIIPPMPLLESLFVFLLSQREGEPGFDINKEIHTLLVRAEEALSVIREFNKRVPLTRIIRCLERHGSWQPKEIPGGEDWFLIYREYWKRQIDDRYAYYIQDRHKRSLLDSFHYFLKGTNLKLLDSAVSNSNPDGFPLKRAFSLSFLLTFYTAVFIPDINKTLKSIMIDGDFVSRENRIEFNESYNGLISMEDMIHKLDKDISPVGDYGKRYLQAKQDMSSLQVKRRKIQIITDEASAEALSLLEEVRRSCRSMINILVGVLNNDTMGKYHPLSNFIELAEKDRNLTNNINDVILKFQKTLEILFEIDEQEMGR